MTSLSTCVSITVCAAVTVTVTVEPPLVTWPATELVFECAVHAAAARQGF
jgi:hypothetical protein